MAALGRNRRLLKKGRPRRGAPTNEPPRLSAPITAGHGLRPLGIEPVAARCVRLFRGFALWMPRSVERGLPAPLDVKSRWTWGPSLGIERPARVDRPSKRRREKRCLLGRGARCRQCCPLLAHVALGGVPQ